MSKPPLLFLSHRIPYPPNKGDKIRSWHLLDFLSKHYTVFLGTFVDDVDDWQYTATLEGVCSQCHFVPLNALSAKLKSLRGLLNGRPLSESYYASSALSDWVKKTCLEHNITRAVAFSSPMTQFVVDDMAPWTHRILDLVDVDSYKWIQYADSKPWPLSWLYRREGNMLLRFEADAAGRFDHSLLVSAPEAELFRRLAPQVAVKTRVIANGVDIEFFKADRNLPNPYPQGSRIIVFTGAMDYWPNIDAVCWFAREVFPKLLENEPSLYFYVVGSNPSRTVKDLANKNSRIVVTGRVSDVRPYVQYADVSVAPLRIARGIQNKVLEAMALETPVIVSQEGLDGIDAAHGDGVLVATTVENHIRFVGEVLEGYHPELGVRGRAAVTKGFCWQNNLSALLPLLEENYSSTGDPYAGIGTFRLG